MIVLNVVMFVICEDLGIKIIVDFKGKNVVVGLVGVGFEMFVGLLFEVYGLFYDDFKLFNNN